MRKLPSLGVALFIGSAVLLVLIVTLWPAQSLADPPPVERTCQQTCSLKQFYCLDSGENPQVCAERLRVCLASCR